MSNPVRTQPVLSFYHQTVLTRDALDSSGQTSLQNQMDAVVGSFISQTTEWRSLAALMVGGLAYRWGRMGVMSLPVAASHVGHVTAMPLRVLSVAMGLGSEVTAYEFTNRVLQSVGAHGRAPLQENPNLWEWSGPGGWKEGWVSSFLAFGALRGVGRVFASENIVLQHFVQDTALVSSHRLFLGEAERSNASLGEQLAWAEGFNLQMGSAFSLIHSLSGGRLMAFERSLDLAIGSNRNAPPFSFFLKGGKSLIDEAVVVGPPRNLPEFSLPLAMNLEPPELKSGGLDSFLDHGPLGRFTRERIGNVNVFTPLLEKPPSLREQAQTKGLLILISGSGLNHTCFGELPKELTQGGWNVKIAVPPGFEDPHHLEHFGRWTVRARALAEGWESSLREATLELIRRYPDSPLYLGGFSMGGAGAVLTYEGLPAPLQQMVEGLVLAAPAFYPSGIKPERPVLGWVIRHVVLPLLSFFNHVNHRNDRRIFSELSDHIPLTIHRPSKMAYGTLLFVEKARASALRLKGRRGLPRTYLLHGGVSDLVISQRSLDFTRETLGPNQIEELELSGEGHYVLAGLNRQEAYDQIKNFLDHAPS